MRDSEQRRAPSGSEPSECPSAHLSSRDLGWLPEPDIENPECLERVADQVLAATLWAIPFAGRFVVTAAGLGLASDQLTSWFR